MFRQVFLTQPQACRCGGLASEVSWYISLPSDGFEIHLARSWTWLNRWGELIGIEQFAIENGPFIVDLPIENCDLPIYSGHYISYNVRPPLASVQLVNITPSSLWFYGIYNETSYWGESKPTYILGASHCSFPMFFSVVWQLCKPEWIWLVGCVFFRAVPLRRNMCSHVW